MCVYVCLCVSGISEVLSSVVDDVSHAVNRNVGGAQLLQELLGAPWLHALLQVLYDPGQQVNTQHAVTSSSVN